MMETFLALSPDFARHPHGRVGRPRRRRPAPRPHLHLDGLRLVLLGAHLRHLAAPLRPVQGVRRAASSGCRYCSGRTTRARAASGYSSRRTTSRPPTPSSTTFADCKIVMTHRSPVSAVPSYASMVHGDDVAVQRPRRPEGRSAATGATASPRRCAAFGEVRARRPDRFVDVPFEATATDAGRDRRAGDGATSASTVGVPTTCRIRGVPRPSTARSGTASHSYTAEDFGLSTEQLDRRLRVLHGGLPVILEDEVVVVTGVGAGLGAKLSVARSTRVRRS